MSNVIFLDVDGVLNSKFWDNEHQREISNGKYIDSEAVKLLGSLVKRTNAKIILHSGWRFWFDETMKPLRPEAEFFANAMKKVGVTPDFKFCFSLIVGNVFQQLYIIVDSIIIGQKVGAKGLSAIGGTDWYISW